MSLYGNGGMVGVAVMEGIAEGGGAARERAGLRVPMSCCFFSHGSRYLQESMDER
jgi:hypothetical protein